MSEAQKGKVHTEEAKAKISEAGRGRVHSEETKRKIGKAHKGKVYSAETRRKIGRASRGRVHTQEAKRKMSEDRRGANSSVAKLSEEDVYGIKLLLRESALSRRGIAARYDVSPDAIRDITTGRTWSHVILPDIQEAIADGG